MASKETHGSGVPIQPSAKSSKAEPQINPDMEMGSLGNEGADQGKAELDIMQIARTGDIAAMEQLFEAKEFDATYCDDEGITALHVCFSNQPTLCHAMPHHVQPCHMTADLPVPLCSGPRSTTNMPCASSLSRTAPR